MKIPKKITVIIRVILTLLLIYLSWKETGVYTAICLLLIFVGIESCGIKLGIIESIMKLQTRGGN